MGKIKKTFYLSEETAESLRKLAYERRKPMGQLVEEGIKLLLSTKNPQKNAFIGGQN